MSSAPAEGGQIGPRQIRVIVNPDSGRGAGARRLPLVLESLSRHGVRPVVMTSAAPGHPVELARVAAAEGASELLVLGGDGTVRDAVEGLTGSSTVLGIIPLGTGNDLIRSLQIPRDLEQAVITGISGIVREIDVWSWNGKPFINVAGVGLDAAVALSVNTTLRALHGPPAYLVGFLSTFARFSPRKVTLRWDGGEYRGKVWVAAFANGQCYGGGMRIAPAAELDDRLLDVVVVEDISRPELLSQFTRLYAGTHVLHPGVRCFRVPNLRVEGEFPAVTLDGEMGCTLPAEISRVPRPLRVRVPSA